MIRLPAWSVGLLATACTVNAEWPAGQVANTAPPPRPLIAATSRSPRVIDLAYGGSFCALRDDGRVACWGHNASSSLGDGSNDARTTPALVPGLDQVRVLQGISPLGFCALRADASLWCWGFAFTGTPTHPTASATPWRIAGDVVEFGFPERRWRGVCMRHRDGRATCVERRRSTPGDCVLWSDDAHTSCLLPRETFVDVARPLSEAGDVRFGALSGDFEGSPVCQLRDGRVFCRGSNYLGQLGDPSRQAADPNVPVPGLTDVVSVDSFLFSSCAVRANGTALCWGRNQMSELVVSPDPQRCPGAGSPTPCNRIPTPLPIAEVAQVVLAYRHVYVVNRAGDWLIACDKASGADCRPGQFQKILGVPPVSRVVAGRFGPFVACALTSSGEVFCHGEGPDIGDGSPLVDRTPVPIQGVRGAVEVDVEVDGACARLAGGGVTCWGLEHAPIGFTDSVGLGIPCALVRDGHVRCWGANDYGEMGLGRRGRPGYPADPQVASVPLPVPRLPSIAMLSTHLGTTVALDRRGAVRVWGTWGPHFPTLSPTEIPGLPPAKAVWSGKGNQCALAHDGGVWCWRDKSQPALVSDLSPATELPSHGPGAQRAEELCVLKEGQLRCHGTPAPAPDLRDIRQLSLSNDQTSPFSRGCAVSKDHTLYCWGVAYCSQYAALCVGGVWNHAERVLDDVQQVSVGPLLTCAVRTDGTVWCWGLTQARDPHVHFPSLERVSKVSFSTSR